MPKKPSLGRGIDAIFLDNSLDSSGSVNTLRVSEVEPRASQPRKRFESEALAALADSVAQHGVLQPILVSPADSSGYYRIIAGERRWRAAKLAGLSEIPAIVMDLDAVAAAQVALIENLQRENLNPYEEAQAYASLIEDFSLTQDAVAQKVGKSRSAITNALRLLELPDEILNMLTDGSLSAGHARALLGLKNKKELLPLAEKVIAKDLSVRTTESLVRASNRLAERVQDEPDPAPAVDYISELERKSRVLLGRRVRISHTPRRRTLSVDYENDDDLEAILLRLCGKELFEDNV